MFKKHKKSFYFKEAIIMTCYFQRGKVECFILFLNYFVAFFSFLCVTNTHTHLPSLQVPMEARRGHQTLLQTGAGVTVDCEPPSVGTKLGSSAKVAMCP